MFTSNIVKGMLIHAIYACENESGYNFDFDAETYVKIVDEILSADKDYLLAGENIYDCLKGISNDHKALRSE